MSKTAVVWSCGHASPDVDNVRFTWLSKFIEDIKPDYTVDLGDGADMKSLNTYDTRYPQALVSASYEQDIESYNESQDILWSHYRTKHKKRPFRIGFEGNHEYRIKKAILHDPRLEGAKHGISFSHLGTSNWFDSYHEYQHSAPSIATYDGVDFAHYFSGGNYGTALSGKHHALSLLTQRMNSAICGHSHRRNVYFQDNAKKIGLVVGCYKGKDEGWAGQSNSEWWRGVVVLRNLENGYFDPQFVSMSALEKEYG